jgi:hypothetical protein
MANPQNLTLVRLDRFLFHGIIKQMNSHKLPNNRKLLSIKTTKTMKTKPYIIPVVTLLTLAASPVIAQETYYGTGDIDGPTAYYDGAGIGSVVVNNDANNIDFTINSTYSMASWIFYAVEIQQVGLGASGSTALVNPWGPIVGISSGENAVIDTYGTGATPLLYSGGSWVQGTGVPYTAGGTGATYASFAVPLSSLGLSVGSSFYFDVVSSYTAWANGGPQGAYAALDNSGWPEMTDSTWTPWDGGTGAYDSSTSPGSFFGTAATEYTVVPEPSTCVLIGMGALAMIRRLRRNV